MKIVYLYDSLAIWGGIERVLIDKMNHLVNHPSGYEIYVITANQGTHAIPYHMDERICHIDLNIGIHKKYRFVGLKRFREGARLNKLYNFSLKKVLNEIDPDLLICTASQDISNLIKIKGRIPLLVESHANFMNPDKIWRKIQRLINNYTIGKADAVIALTEGDAANWRIVSKNVHVIPNIVHLNKTGKYSNCISKNIIFVGRFTRQKGIDRLLEIWKKVHAAFPDWHLNMYGEGELWQHYYDKAAELDININISKPVHNIFDKYLESSMLLMTSYYEPFGLVVPEAMSCGLPVVAFDCPYGPGDIIKDGINGFLINDDDIDMYVDRVCLLISNEKQRQLMGKNAIATSNKYSSEEILPIWLTMFQRFKKQKMITFDINKPIPLVYWNVPNFGDLLSPYIVARLSKQEVKHRECYRGLRYVCLETIKRITRYVPKSLYSINSPLQCNLLGVGSIISWGNGNSIVWGSGFMNSADGFKGEKAIYAVRGKYTDQKLQAMGFEGCNVYGDPALLLPLLIDGADSKKHTIGLVPHITETDYFIKHFSDKIKVIDLRTNDIEKVVSEITSCERILSTSLHGIITAHAYGIQALWIKKHFINTDGFKFKDYFSSVGITEYDGITGFEDLIGDKQKCLQLFDDYKNASLPTEDLSVIRQNLLNAAPFRVINSIDNSRT